MRFLGCCTVQRRNQPPFAPNSVGEAAVRGPSGRGAGNHPAPDYSDLSRPDYSDLSRYEVSILGQIVRVLPSSEGGWCVEIEGTERVSSEHRLQLDAIEEGRRLAKAQQATLFIHGMDGLVRELFKYDDNRRRSYVR